MENSTPEQTKKFLPFVPQLAEKVMDGSVQATTRYHRHPFYPKNREHFRAHCQHRPLEGLYQVTSRRNMKLGQISKLHYLEVGMDSPVSFPELWCDICGLDSFDPEMICTFYQFIRVN